MFDAIVSALHSNPQRFHVHEKTAIEIFERNRDLVISTARFLVQYIEILFLTQNSFQIKRFLALLFPEVSILVHFKEGLDAGHCECVTAGRTQVTFYFTKWPVAWLLPVVIARWLPVLEIFRYNLMREPMNGKLLINFHDEGNGYGLNFCDNRDFDYLIPDPEFLASRGYRKASTHFKQNEVRWDDRSNKLFWRGSTTGTRTGSVLDLPRVKLCVMGKSHKNFDAYITSAAQISSEDEKTLKDLGIFGNFINSESYNKYRYHLDIDGNTNAWSALFLKLLSGGLVFKVASPFGFKQWYYDRLVPWEHFVPICSDLSDLENVFARLSSDQNLAKAIAQQGCKFASSMTFEEEVARTSNQIKRLATPIVSTHTNPGEIVTVLGDVESHQLAFVLSLSLDRALLNDSKLSPDTLKMPGFVGSKSRHLLNNIVCFSKNSRYIEIGSWIGSSASAALEMNRVCVTCIDDFSEALSSQDSCMRQLSMFKTPGSICRLIAKDFREVDFSAIVKSNIFFYDGAADTESYKDAFQMVQAALDDVFILVINNWNWDFVRRDALNAMREADIEALYTVDIRSSNDNTHPHICCEESDWHNGIYAAAARKTTNRLKQ